jgi:hypothetical protein
VEVDAEAAQVVRQIFGWYVTDRLSGQHIAHQLTNREIVPPRGGRSYWDPSTVKFILTNEAYVGSWYLNRFRMEPRAEQRRPRVCVRPRQEWIAVAIPALIGSEVFLRAQEIRASGCHQGPWPLTHPETHLLLRLVVCGNCNRAMTSLNSTNGGHRYYWCRGADPHRIMAERSWCPHPTVSAPELDAIVWADVVSLLSDPELLLSAWQEQHQIDKKTNLSEEELRRLKHQVSDGKSQCRRLVDAYQKQAIELEELVSRRTAIEQRLESIQRIIDDLAAEPKLGLSFADLERNIDEVCRSLSGRLQGMDMNARMSICRDLIDKVVVDNYNVEIHYKFPVSGNTNRKRERPKILEAAFRIGALDTGDTLSVVTAAFESVDHLGDTFQTELAVVLGVEGVVGMGEGGEMVVEDESQGIRPPRDIRGRGCDRDYGGRGEHTPKDSLIVSAASPSPCLSYPAGRLVDHRRLRRTLRRSRLQLPRQSVRRRWVSAGPSRRDSVECGLWFGECGRGFRGCAPRHEGCRRRAAVRMPKRIPNTMIPGTPAWKSFTVPGWAGIHT